MSKPILEIPERERWLFAPENKAILEELQQALQQKTEDYEYLGSFAKYAKSSKKSGKKTRKR